jgi:chaperonin GroEL
MSLFQASKPKSAGKVTVPSSNQLSEVVCKTLNHMAQMAGATLGPGGKQVLIERGEIGMKPILTKDGVSVIKSLGYDGATQQLILEAARDAAIRTATEAGDGTTTATVLSAAITNATAHVVANNPKVSPQKIVRELQKIVPVLIKMISDLKIDVTGENYQEVLLKVATLSANGDTELSSKVLEGLDLVGDEGDLTIVEGTGESRYSINRINGYTVDRGLEESCRNLAQGFINDKSGTMVVLDNPIFILYDGVINDFGQIFDGLSKLNATLEASGRPDRNVVVVAHGFGEMVLGDLHHNWNHPKAPLKVYPMLTPEKAIANWRTQFLYDLQAYTGATVFNPVDRPVIDIIPESVIESNRATRVEISRFKSMVFAKEDVDAVSIRVDELKFQKNAPESEYELNDLNVRIGKLTSGIVRLEIFGPSSGETREKRDRAEDAWMALKGATKYGAVPGGGYVLVRLAAALQLQVDKIPPSAKKYAYQILAEALLEPVKLLYKNYGFNDEETTEQIFKMLNNDDQAYDILEEMWVPKEQLLDSVPAVSEAIRNSISIASLLGTLGGIVAFKRDYDSDKEEERLIRNFEASIGERGSLAQGE